MPFISLTKGSKSYGVQTYARAKRLSEPLQGVEMEYLDVRDWYVNQVGLIAQLDEALAQAKKRRQNDRVTEIGNRLHAEQSKLRDLRDRVRLSGERSWSEAFYLAASHMLPKEALSAISTEADEILGRTRHELARS